LKKSLKKQIKQDELASGYASMGEWVRAHVDEVKTGAIGVVVLAVALGGWIYFRGQRVGEAQRSFDEAFTAFAAPVGQADAPGGFATKEEKYKKALAGFEGVAGRFGSLTLGRRARYYAALCRVELGQRDDAAKALREIAAQAKSNAAEPGLADLALAGLDRSQQAYSQALTRYEQLLKAGKSAVPRDYLLMSMAETLEEGGRMADASAAFKRLVDEMPTSPFAGDARTRAEYLKLAAAR
jgi:tetratricopeptide (TPR) repeat protein